MASSDSDSDSSSLTASQVGSDFVKNYYELLQKQPESVQHLYTSSSTMIRVDGESTDTASSISQIHALVLSLNYTEIDIKTINSAESSSGGNHGIVAVVAGSVKSDRFGGSRKFVETFCLALEKEKSFLVISDIFHYVSEEDFSGILYAKHYIEICLIKRKDSETVEDFLFRFMKEISQVSGAGEEIKILGFINGVRNKELVERLYENFPNTIVEMINQVKAFIMAQKYCDLLDDDHTWKLRHSSRSFKRKRNVRSWMEKTIMFPAIRTKDFQDEPLVITATVAGYHVRRIHIDGGCASEIMFESCFLQLGEDVGRILTEDASPLVTLRGEEVRPIGQVRLPVVIGNGDKFRKLEMTFSVVRARSSPNIIIGRSGIRALGAVASTIHGAIKFPTPRGVVTLFSGELHRVVMPNADDDGDAEC